MMARPHRAVKIDANQPEIVADLRKLGAYVWITASLGGEVLDIIVFWHGLAIPVEIKVPGKRDDLTEGEHNSIRKLREVGIEPVVATCTEDIVRAFETVPFTDVMGELGSAMIPDGETGERRFGTPRQILTEYIPDYGETDEPQYTEGSPLTNFRHGELIE